MDGPGDLLRSDPLESRALMKETDQDDLFEDLINALNLLLSTFSCEM